MTNENKLIISKNIDEQITAVMDKKIKGFEKAFVISSAIQILRENLSPEFMAPMMKLQGSRLGFLTDKDRGNGYPSEKVKDCLIDAVLLGLQPTGNHFNIIGGNMYPTREGFGYLLDGMKGLKKNFEFLEVTKVENAKVSPVTVLVTWQLPNEEPQKNKIKFLIKSDQYTSHDALVGKAERKAKRWLYNTLKGTDISDGDVQDVPHKDVTPKVDPELERQRILLNDVKTQDDVDFARGVVTDKILIADLDLLEIKIKQDESRS